MKLQIPQSLEMLAGKSVLITGTANENSFAFHLAHLIRNYAKVTYCVDPRYKLTEERPKRYRIIEEGRVVLISCDVVAFRPTVYKIIEKDLKGHVDYEIIINEVWMKDETRRDR